MIFQNVNLEKNLPQNVLLDDNFKSLNISTEVERELRTRMNGHPVLMLMLMVRLVGLV